MSIFSQVFASIAPLFALIAVGYLAKKARILHATDAPVLNRLVLSITLPSFVLYALITNPLEIIYMRLPFVFWITQGLILGAVLVMGRVLRATPAQIGAMILVSAFGNTGYIGYPMTTALYPDRLPAAVIIDQLGMSVMLYPGAVVLGSLFGRQGEAKGLAVALQFLRTPLFGAMALGIVLRCLPSAWIPHNPVAAQLGGLLLAALKLASAATIPVVMIAVGLLLRPASLPAHARQVALVAVLKLAALPMFVWLIARYVFSLHGSVLAVCVLEAAMPPSASATVFAGEFGMDGSLAVASFFALTIASAVTLPLMLTFLR